MEATRSSETSVLTNYTRRKITEDGLLQSMKVCILNICTVAGSQPEDYEPRVQLCQRMLHGMLISDKAQFNDDRINNIHEILTCGRPTILNGLLKEPPNIDTY
jgi:hypothetical protein